MVTDDILFHLFPNFISFHIALKVPGLKKYKSQQENTPYQKEISAQDGKILLDISYLTLWMTIQCDLQ